MTAILRSVTCERIRAQVSLQLDDELSELERRMLDAHVARCEGCRSYATRVGEFTEMLRKAPYERLSRPVVVTLPRRVSAARLQVAMAAALAFAAVGLGTQLATTGSRAHTWDTAITRYPTNAELEAELELIAHLPDRDRPVAGGNVL